MLPVTAKGKPRRVVAAPKGKGKAVAAKSKAVTKKKGRKVASSSDDDDDNDDENDSDVAELSDEEVQVAPPVAVKTAGSSRRRA